MRLKGIKWVVGRSLERCFPVGHKAAIVSDLAICTVELSSVMAISLMQGIGCVVLLAIGVLVAEGIGRWLLREKADGIAPTRQSSLVRHSVLLSLIQGWWKGRTRQPTIRHRRIAAAGMSRRRILGQGRAKNFAASYR